MQKNMSFENYRAWRKETRIAVQSWRQRSRLMRNLKRDQEKSFVREVLYLRCLIRGPRDLSSTFITYLPTMVHLNKLTVSASWATM
jgi:hypothetical protein